MSINELVQKKWWKTFISRLYGWGASVVMIGALMKLEHYPLSSYFLMAGLGTEAIIFFFSAFEPQFEDWRWDRIYPELKDSSATPAKRRPQSSGTAWQQFDSLLEKAEITPELFARLGNGMQNLADATGKMGDISQAHLVTQQYTDNVKKAADHLEQFSDTYAKSTVELEKSASELTESYTKSANVVAQTGARLVEQVNQSSDQLASSYQHLLEAINKDYARLTQDSHSYTEELQKLNKNLSALNSVYELQLQGSDAYLKTTQQVYSGLDSMMENLSESVQNTKVYREEVERLGKKLIALNTVYGNMLTAMNIRDNV
ncbi:MAG: gliding motility protein GldL [Bacteroidales bacterium]|nr:gliding motility protein GldL [Bacteroidales bacterium]